MFWKVSLYPPKVASVSLCYWSPLKRGKYIFWSSFMPLSSNQAKRPLIPNLHHQPSSTLPTKSTTETLSYLHKTDYYREANTAQTVSSQSPRAHSSGRKRPLNIEGRSLFISKSLCASPGNVGLQDCFFLWSFTLCIYAIPSSLSLALLKIYESSFRILAIGSDIWRNN